jgi:hypothetical protein
MFRDDGAASPDSQVAGIQRLLDVFITAIWLAFDAFWMYLSMKLGRAGMPPFARAGVSG